MKLDKADEFIGKDALLRARGQPLRKKLVTLVFDPEAWAWGGESISLAGDAVGEISSTGWSPAVGACVALGYLRGEAAQRMHDGTPVQIDLWGAAVAATAWDAWPARATGRS